MLSNKKFEEWWERGNLTPLQAVIIAAKIRLRPRLMIGLALGLFVALFLMPCFYVLFQRREAPKPIP